MSGPSEILSNSSIVVPSVVILTFTVMLILLHLLRIYHMALTELGALHVFFLLTFTTISQSRYYLDPSFTEEETEVHAAAWMDLETIILSEVSQKEKDKYHMISLICGI